MILTGAGLGAGLGNPVVVSGFTFEDNLSIAQTPDWMNASDARGKAAGLNAAQISFLRTGGWLQDNAICATEQNATLQGNHPGAIPSNPDGSPAISPQEIQARIDAYARCMKERSWIFRPDAIISLIQRNATLSPVVQESAGDVAARVLAACKAGPYGNGTGLTQDWIDKNCPPNSGVQVNSAPMGAPTPSQQTVVKTTTDTNKSTGTQTVEMSLADRFTGVTSQINSAVGFDIPLWGWAALAVGGFFLLKGGR